MPIPTFLTLGYTRTHFALLHAVLDISFLSAIVFRTAADSASRLSAFWATAGTTAARQRRAAIKLFFIGNTPSQRLGTQTCGWCNFINAGRPQKLAKPPACTKIVPPRNLFRIEGGGLTLALQGIRMTLDGWSVTLR